MSDIIIADLGRANVASLMAAFGRLGLGARLSREPGEILAAEAAVLPGVGAFGEVAARLESAGLAAAFRSRVGRGLPTLGICLGMQLFFKGSDESPGAVGIGALPGRIERIRTALPLPQFGWNRVSGGGALVAVADAPVSGGGISGGAAADADAAGGGIADGGGSVAWAYYANGYALAAPPQGWVAAWSRYGSPFVAALERGPMLLCQFHPELSGDWGLRLLGRWARRAQAGVLRPEEERAAALSTMGEAARPSPSAADDSAAAAGRGAAPGVIAPGVIARRIIPCLDVDGGRVVKGTRFLELRDLGEPAELARRYEDQGADELCILDITAGIQGRAAALETIRAVRAACGLPICAGGGVRSVDDAEALLMAGADKIAVNSRAYRDPALVTGIARAFGSQACVVAIDATRDASGGGPGGQARVALDAGRTVVDEGAASWAARAVGLGAGEILLTSRDRDGTGSGYDLALLAEVTAAVGGAPVIASGGASDPAAVAAGFGAGAQAALLAGALHRGELSIGDIKTYVRLNGVEVRV